MIYSTMQWGVPQSTSDFIQMYKYNTMPTGIYICTSVAQMSVEKA